MRKDKEQVFELRKQGKTYRQIQRETGVSRGTLSDWFKGISWSRHIAESNEKRTTSSEQIKMMQAVRRKKLEELYRNAELEAVMQYETYKTEPLFWAGLMVYAGEGDKSTRHLIRITNSEFYFHNIFIMFLIKYLKIDKDSIKCGLLLYPDLNESLCKEMWSNLLEIKRENFYKTHVLQGKEKLRRLQYGVAMSIISNTELKKKVLKWMSLAQDEKFNFAGMV